MKAKKGDNGEIRSGQTVALCMLYACECVVSGKEMVT